MDKCISTELNSTNLIKHVLYKDYSPPAELSFLNLTQERVLLTIKNSINVSMVSIARTIGLEKGPFSQIIDKLETLLLVERIRQANNKRIVSLKLTAKGELLAENILNTMENHFKKVTADLTTNELNDLFHAFDVIKTIANKLLKNK